MRTLGLVSSICALALLAAPSKGLAYYELFTAGGYEFDIWETGYGYLSDGTSNAYDGCYRLRVNGSTYSSGSTPYTTSLSGRQIELPEKSVGSLMVRRLIYVPETGGDWGRFVEVLRNDGTTDVTASVEYHCNLGSNTSTVVTATSGGDTTVGVDDHWVATDDGSDGTGTPSLAHVFQGPLSRAPATAASLYSDDDLDYSYDVTVPAGGQVVLLTFAVQTTDRASAEAEAERLVTLPGDALVGIDALLPDVVNFTVGGAPFIRITGPANVAEGEEIVFEVEVEDPEGDTATWSWDGDDDGTFAESTDATTYTIATGTTDGDGMLRVGVEASDGTESRSLYRTVTIYNVAPTITSPPSTPALFIGSDYRYEVAVDDPAGDADPITYELLTAPEGMTVDVDGVVTWTPTSGQRGSTYAVELQVSDDEGDTDMQAWELSVSENRPPAAPAPAEPVERAHVDTPTPTLSATNATDPDGDELTYHFQVDRVSSFTSPDLQQSPPLVEMAEQTRWTVPVALEEGQWYWQVWVNDGLVDSPHMHGIFIVGEAPEDAGTGGWDGDGGIPDPRGDDDARTRDRGGCAAAGGPVPGSAWWLVGALAVLLRRRRR